ncbi:MAG: DUF3000 domain-containing protein [Candidatus Nanopelagicales bacterium]|jgi:hypothetical protein|nr:DUF3000 domain-containing protein [Candidatus Nanopelagicales bacterium]
MRAVTAQDQAFEAAVSRIRMVKCRPEFELEEAPAPSRLAPFALAITADSSGEEDLASGRFVLLHDPDGVDEWEGTFRAVVFVRAALESDLIDDPLLHEVGWSWLTESLQSSGCEYLQLGGTITRNAGRSFGTMSDRPTDGYLEMRASWTPATVDGDASEHMDRHTRAWLRLLDHAAGLQPLPEDVSHVMRSKMRAQR